MPCKEQLVWQEPHAQHLVVSYLFGKGQHKEATEMLVQQLMALNPGADRDKLLKYCYFDANGLVVSWNLSCCRIAELPETFGDLLCSGDLYFHLQRGGLRS